MSGRSTAMQRAKIVRDCLLAAGVPEVSIELQDGRPSYGDTWNACQPVGALSHHVASVPTPDRPTPGLALVKTGRSDLPGPLANGTAGVDLVYRILTLGYANHPGFGGPLTLSGPMGAFTIPKDNGRAYLWGTEYEGGYSEAVWDREYTNARTGATMTFREFMGRCNAGLVYAVWLINGKGKTPEWSLDLSGYHGEHKTWAPGRKPDRLNYSTESGRSEIRKYATLEDDVTAQDVWDYRISPMGEGKSPIKAQQMLKQAHNRAYHARAAAWAAEKNTETLLRKANLNRKAIQALAATLEPTVSKAIADALGPDGDDRIFTAADAPDEQD